MENNYELGIMNVPQLRFPEFQGEWEKKKLGNIAVKIGDGLHGTPNYSFKTGFYFINGNNLIEGKISINKNTKEVGEKIYVSNNKHLSNNTLLLSINGTIGNVARYYGEKVMLGKSVAYFNFNEDSSFYFNLLKTSNIQNHFSSELTGTTIKNLSLKTLRETEISFPSQPEQIRIANFFTILDNKINQLKEKKALLEEYKKGMMQKIFSQEIRFKPALSEVEGDDDGKEFPDWVNKELGELLNYEQPTKYLVNSTEYDDKHKTPVITAGKTFILGYTNEDDGIFETDLPVIAFDDFTTAIQFVDFKFKVKSSAMKILIAKKDVNIKFVFEAMQRIKFAIGGHGRHWISVFSQIPIKYPSSKEQTKIANFLSKIDDKIKTVNEQIEESKEYKKGLLQKMYCV